MDIFLVYRFLNAMACNFKTNALRFSKFYFFHLRFFDEICLGQGPDHPNAKERHGAEHADFHLKVLFAKIPPDWGSESRNQLLTWIWSPSWPLLSQTELNKKCACNGRKMYVKPKKNVRETKKKLTDF